jgi:folylpolyglutamate synthase/dihydropteroate synthase
LEAALAAVWLLVQNEDAQRSSIESDIADRLREGIARCRWPGRMEVVISGAGQALVLDGAHCPLSAEAAARVVAHWQQGSILPQRGPVEVLWGMQRDKDHRAFLETLARSAPPGLFGGIHTYRVTGVRGAEAELLAHIARELDWNAQPHESAESALEAAARKGRNVLAIGTLYTLASLRAHWAKCAGVD